MTIAGLLAVLGIASSAQAQEEQLSLDRVPRAVMKSAKARFPGADIKEASEETEDGKPVIALEMKHHRRDVSATFMVDGTLVLVVTSVPAKDLPKVVRHAVERRYPGASVRGADSVTKGPLVKKKADYYELYLMTANQKPALVQVDLDGKVLRPEAKPVEGNGDQEE